MTKIITIVLTKRDFDILTSSLEKASAAYLRDAIRWKKDSEVEKMNTCYYRSYEVSNLHDKILKERGVTYE